MYELPKCYATHLSAKQSIYNYVLPKYRLTNGRMPMQRISSIIILIGCILTLIQAQNWPEFPVLNGPYLGQVPPGDEPELFAPGIVSTGMYTRDIAITPDGNEIYFCVTLPGFNFATILYSRQENGIWSVPEVVPHMDDPHYFYFEPHISHDGRKLLFLSNQPDPDAGETTGGDQDIWVMERSGDDWNKPYNLGEPVNSDSAEYYPSLTRNGTLYFSRQPAGSRNSYIYRSRLINGKYTTPERLGPEVNSGQSQYNAFIDPDERFIIVPTVGREDSYGGADYYISFRTKDDTWSGPVNLGDKINTPRGQEHSAYVSPDGKYFFFMSVRTPLDDESFSGKTTYALLKSLYISPMNGNPGIYWMRAEFIERLHTKSVQTD